LADTGADLAHAMNHCLRIAGRRKVAIAEAEQFAGGGARLLIERGLQATGESSQQLIDELLESFLEYYARNICVHTSCYPGVHEQLKILEEQGYPLGVCTNKPEGLARSLLQELGIIDRFQSIIGGDSLAVRKPEPEPLVEVMRQLNVSRSILIGDSVTDYKTARAAGQAIILVRFGFGSKGIIEDAIKMDPDCWIDNFDQLPEALNNLDSCPG